ncbi:hypothetical protein HELRODRAFT_189781 [Helobdella robusta]|uniref:GPI inositol-deacylase n=1 Tax=Helobdella robusta TaxID=6412 RepID=T1FRD4_HELRO|nr:hypothetical protein HELRODRAFT_189781 [Helobdella robusta]ESN91714.1 hypothetical protein HELRODRAFT_189781 [Helobdella robusta]
MFRPFVFCLHLAVLFILYLGFQNVFLDVEKNDCQMTYMFQEPLYIKVKLDASLKLNYPNYNLYYYNEGSSHISLNGVPALFIPGNAGSYRQVRSLGSVALRMAENIPKKNKIDFFAIDFNEELSGFFGGFLEKQSEFAFLCVDHILSIYNRTKNNKQSSMFIVGHSMGGLVGRALFKYGINDDKVPVIITQASPHQMPVLLVDEEMKRFHQSLYYPTTTENMPNVTLVSTGGGSRDFLVRMAATRPGKLFGNIISTSVSAALVAVFTFSIFNYFSGVGFLEREINTVSMPKAWVSTDHLCHVWCKQVVMATVRAMYDCVDESTKQITKSPPLRHEVLKYHFVENRGPKHYTTSFPSNFKLNKLSIEWKEVNMPWKFYGSVEKSMHAAFNVKTLVYDGKIIAVSNLEFVDWVGACSVNCDEMISFKSKTMLLPSEKGQFLKVVQLDYNDLRTFDWLVITIPASNQNDIQIAVEHMNPRQRTLTKVVPFLLKPFTKHFSQLADGNNNNNEDIVITETTFSKNSIYHKLNMKGFYDVLQAFHVSIEPVNCGATTQGHSVLKFQSPWSNDPTYTVLRDKLTEVNIMLSSNEPHMDSTNRRSIKQTTQQHQQQQHSPPYLELYIASSCSYRMKVTLSKSSMAGQFVRFYMHYIPSFLVVQVFLVFGRQLKTFQSVMLDVNVCLFTWYHPFSVIPLVAAGRYLLRLISQLLVYMDFCIFTFYVHTDDDDITILKRNDIWNSAVLVILYFVSMILVSLLSYICQFALYLCAKVMNPVCRRLYSNKLGVFLKCLTLTCAALSSWFVCGACGLLFVLIVHLARVFSMYLDTPSVKSFQTIMYYQSNIRQFYLTTFLLFFFQFVVNAPSLVVYIKDKNVYSMHDDPSFCHAVVAIVTSIVLTSSSYPLKYRLHSKAVSYVIHLTALFTVLYATVTLYRLPYFIDLILIILLLHCILSSIFSSSDSSSSRIEDVPLPDGGLKEFKFCKKK